MMITIIFFHDSASAKKKINKIEFLTNDEGEKIENHNGMCEIIQYYFSKLFTEEECTNDMPNVDSH